MFAAIATYTGLFYTLNCFGFEPLKARAFNSFINAAFLSYMGIISFSAFLVHQYDTPNYLLRKPEQVWLTDYIIGFFTIDLVLGHFYGGLNLITGYVHHSIYILLLLYLRLYHESNLIYLCLPFELPTMFQSLQQISPQHYRPYLSAAFGSTFVLFRLVGNSIVIYMAYQVSMLYTIVASLMMITHIAWFSEWTYKRLLTKPRQEEPKVITSHA
jgi:hypothetical protein